VSVAVLTALAVDLAYESRVSLRIAANARDELRASYLARSGVTLSRLVLSFQPDSGPAAAAAAAGIQIPRFQIWRMVPVGTDLAAALFPATAAVGAASGEGRAPSFEATIDDEATKVNAQLEGFAKTGDRKLWAQVRALYQLICDARWDPLFDREDASGQRNTREDVLVHLRDWVDDENPPRTTGLVPFSGAHCAGIPAVVPFEDAFGDENQPYDRGDDRYRAKNNRMDSLDELYLVAGIGDAFMAAFGDALTVYLPRDAKRNVNVLDRDALVQLAALIAEPAVQPRLVDPAFGELLQASVRERTFNGMLAISPVDFAQLVMAAGVTVNQELVQSTADKNPFTDSSDTFRVRATGKAGDVASTIDAVVRLTKTQGLPAFGQQGQQSAGQQGQQTAGQQGLQAAMQAAQAAGQQNAPTAAPGRLIHWREE
jgi:general secretion pathway protein K